MTSLLGKMTLARHQLESYKHDAAGVRGQERRKFHPKAELARCRRVVRRHKVAVKSLLRDIHEMNRDMPRLDKILDENGEMDWDDIFCSVCGQDDGDESNDILLCDHEGCFRGYHVNCCDPPLNPECLDEEYDWFCWQCETYSICLDLVCADFNEDWNSWEEVFPELDRPEEEEEESAAEGGGGSPAVKPESEEVEDLPSSDSDDEDWDGDDEASDVEDGADARMDEELPRGLLKVGVEELRALIQDAREGGSTIEEDPFDMGDDLSEANILSGKRRRKPVDYRKLADQMEADNELIPEESGGSSEEFSD
mmetsp:Transcript_13252/g.39406  ORF Transcript_13252/g.39406 Transcript_13252/m.39406 type:complete len:310 (-) Transcript_13252:135-1064(-)